jgi:hypothetical protein
MLGTYLVTETLADPSGLAAGKAILRDKIPILPSTIPKYLTA